MSKKPLLENVVYTRCIVKDSWYVEAPECSLNVFLPTIKFSAFHGGDITDLKVQITATFVGDRIVLNGNMLCTDMGVGSTLRFVSNPTDDILNNYDSTAEQKNKHSLDLLNSGRPMRFMFPVSLCYHGPGDFYHGPGDLNCLDDQYLVREYGCKFVSLEESPLSTERVKYHVLTVCVDYEGFKGSEVPERFKWIKDLLKPVTLTFLVSVDYEMFMKIVESQARGD